MASIKRPSATSATRTQMRVEFTRARTKRPSAPATQNPMRMFFLSGSVRIVRSVSDTPRPVSMPRSMNEPRRLVVGEIVFGEVWPRMRNTISASRATAKPTDATLKSTLYCAARRKMSAVSVANAASMIMKPSVSASSSVPKIEAPYPAPEKSVESAYASGTSQKEPTSAIGGTITFPRVRRARI